MLKEYRMLSFVERWGIAPRHHHQNVADHSFFVTLYASELCEMLGVRQIERAEVLDAALRHDAFEAWTSDPPGPAKRSLFDPVKAKAYHAKFAEGMGEFYSVSVAATDTDVQTTVNSKFGGRWLSIRNIIKVADLTDEVFYLAFERNLGNNMVLDLYQRELSRLDQAAIALAGEDFAAHLMDVLGKQIARIGDEGAVIPVNDTDIQKPANEDEPLGGVMG